MNNKKSKPRKTKPINKPKNEDLDFMLDLEGYPMIWHKDRMVRIIRLLYSIHHSDFDLYDETKKIELSCSNRKCINPEHAIIVEAK